MQPLLFLTALIAPFVSALADPLPSIAITDFEARGIPAHEAAIIADRIRAQIVRSGAFQVMERGQMEEILKEQGFQASGACADSRCVVELGQLLAVSAIVTGAVGKIGEMYTIDLKLVDIKTGRIRRSISEDIKGSAEDVLTVAVPRICDRLIREATATTANVGYVSVRSDPKGASVSIDNREIGATPLDGVEVEAGARTIDLALDGYALQRRHVTLLKGETRELSFTMSPTGELLTARKAESSRKRRAIGNVMRWTGAALALAGAGAATYFWLDADANHADYAASNDSGTLPGLWDTTQSSATSGNISAIIGGVGILFLGVSFAF